MTKPISTSQILREMAEDYLHLAQDADGNVDALRKRNYKWLVKFAETMPVPTDYPNSTAFASAWEKWSAKRAKS